MKSERRGKDFSYDMSSKKLRNLGWKSNFNIYFGIKETKYWIENNLRILKKQD